LEEGLFEMAGVLQVLVVALVALGSVVYGQTCPCSFAPVVTQSQVVLSQAGSPNLCVTETRPTGGCFCVMGAGDAGVCQIDTTAQAYAFIGSGPACESFTSPAALCPGDVVAVTCSISRNVAWVLPCEIPASSFPAGATIVSLSASIKQDDNVTFNGVGTAGDDYTVTYQTINLIAPVGDLNDWPDTPVKTGMGTIGSSGTATYFEASDIPEVTISATPAGISNANTLLSGGNDLLYQFATQQQATATGFDETTWFPVLSSASVTLTAVYV